MNVNDRFAGRLSTMCLALMLFALMAVSALAVEIEQAPYRPGAVMVNGKFSPGEWNYPPVFRAYTDNGVDIRVQQDSLFVYIGLNDYAPGIYDGDLDTNHTGIDLYIDDMDGNLRLLHVSTAFGESELKDSAWSEMKWAENHDWTACLTQSIYEEGKQKFIGPENFEFQISKRMISGKAFRMMSHYKRPEKIAPSGAKPDSPETWLFIELDR